MTPLTPALEEATVELTSVKAYPLLSSQVIRGHSRNSTPGDSEWDQNKLNQHKSKQNSLSHHLGKPVEFRMGTEL